MNAEDVVADIKSRMTEKKIRRYSEPGRRVVRRPEEILRDVRGLKLRQRVSLVLGDEILREELEEAIKNSTINGVTRADTIRTFQDFLLPTLQPNYVSSGSGHGGGAGVVLPINDIRGGNTVEYSKAERVMRCKLAAMYRLVDLFGLSETIFNHISVRTSDKEEFFLNPFGLLYSEITASSLIRVDSEGNVLDQGSTSLGLNKAGWVLHSTIHTARPDIKCVIHVHTPEVITVASTKCGFLRLSQESLIVGEVTYHDYFGILINEEEKESITQDLGPTSMVMFLRNHGVVVCGKTMEEAFVLLHVLIDACSTQVKAMSVGLENLNVVSDEAYQQVQGVMKNKQSVIKGKEGQQAMTLDQYVFEAHMRWLDSQGYRTGYPYHMPDIFTSGQPPRKTPEAQVPPQATSDRDPYSVYFDYQRTNEVRRTSSMGRGNTYRNRVKWLNKPVQGTKYMKEEKEKVQKIQAVAEENDEKNEINGINGHDEDEADEVVGTTHKDEQISETVAGNTKIVTKTTTLTETKVVTGHTKAEVVTNVVSDDVKPVNGHNDAIEADTSKEDIKKSETSLNPPSESGSAAGGEEGVTSPNKVKKSRSFKKAFMKKRSKKEEKNGKAK